jgi:hypothetical protein
MRGKGSGRRKRRSERVDESDYYELVVEGHPTTADQLFADWLAQRGLALDDIRAGRLRIKTSSRGDWRAYFVHLDILRDH